MPDVLAVDRRDVGRALDSGATPTVAVVLGSGLGGLAQRVTALTRIPYAELSSYPAVASEVRGHAGELVIGELERTEIAMFLGRVHRYQGASARDAAWTARFAAALGCRVLVVTNAAGGIDPSIEPGMVGLIRDHINLTGDDPLIGWTGPPGATPFVPMGDAYDPALRVLAAEAAQRLGVPMREVVYAGVLGPSYETPAEVEYLRRIGAHVVGMSTVLEVIAARALGLRVLGLSLITNVAGGAELSHDEVLAAGERAAQGIGALIEAVVASAGAPPSGAG